MKLKAIGLKFALGAVLLLIFTYILISCSNVFSLQKYKDSDFYYSQFESKENLSLVIYEEEGAFIRNSDVIEGSISFLDGVIYFDGKESYTFVIVSTSSLFLSSSLQYFDKVGG